MKKILALLSLLTLFSCYDNDENEEIKSTISGTITASEIMDNINLDSIMVLLIDADFVVDTINYQNQAAFLDTVYTNSEGSFVFNNVQAGNYYVLPLKESYRFEGNNFSEDDTISVNTDENIELHYTATVQVRYGFYSYSWTVTNAPWTYSGTLSYKYKISRLTWFFYVPVWVELEYSKVTKDGPILMSPKEFYTFTDSFDYGFSIGVMTQTDAYMVEITITDYEGRKITKTFRTHTAIGKTPDELIFDLDWETGKTIRRFPSDY